MARIYYRIEPRGSRLSTRSTATTGGDPLPPGYVFVFDESHLVFASDTFDQAITEPDNWDVLELFGRDPYDPGDFEGVAVRPSRVVRRCTLLAWVKRQLKSRDSSTREYAQAVVDRL